MNSSIVSFYLKHLFLLLSLSFISCNPNGPSGNIGHHLPELKLIQVLPVSGYDNLEPSGLVWDKGVLYSVSDNHDDIIFRIVMTQDKAVFIPHRTFSPPDNRGKDLDLEGIDLTPKGDFLLACEGRTRVLEVDPAGRSRWATPFLNNCCRSAGLCAKKNAGLEGIALRKNRLYLAAEREVRGFLEIPDFGTSNSNNDSAACDALSFLRSRYPFLNKDELDFSGLSTHGGNLYALSRNQYLVIRMATEGETIHEGEAWSYRMSETSEKYRYRTMKYGRAEGLAVTADRVYIILDNNGDRRTVNNEDRRPLLFVLKWPAGKKN